MNDSISIAEKIYNWNMKLQEAILEYTNDGNNGRELIMSMYAVHLHINLLTMYLSESLSDEGKVYIGQANEIFEKINDLLSIAGEDEIPGEFIIVSLLMVKEKLSGMISAIGARMNEMFDGEAKH